MPFNREEKDVFYTTYTIHTTYTTNDKTPNPIATNATKTPGVELHFRLALPLRAISPNVVNPSIGDAPTDDGVTFLNIWVGSIFDVEDTWNCGATGVPSHWNKCNLYPVTGSATAGSTPCRCTAGQSWILPCKDLGLAGSRRQRGSWLLIRWS